ncbi:MAG TPA: prevent-host-death protein [Lentisphaeria bacterium]|nr:MAG: prevent-host-death protein [Lentisphaerae bacterium GWF2_50_93]HCE45605.1 prevent-host-death protein [Lentisphaeria bacterium]
MKFLTVRELRGNCAKVWKQLPEEMEMVVTNNGKPVAILSSVAESNLEESLSSIRRARATQAVLKMQEKSARIGLDKITSIDIDTEIAEVRRTRRR